MTLLNSVAMFAAVAVIVPIFVHLKKRRKSKIVDWPAMQFLKRTVTSRRRGLTLEHLILLSLRCLLVLLFVFAMARPAIESARYLRGVMFFLLAGSAILLLTAAIVSNWRRRNRFIGVVVAACLFGGAGAMLSAGSESLVDSNVDSDIAIVIDSSLTMTLSDDETSHFDEAMSQAQSLVETLSGDSTVSIVVAGPLAETVDGSPFRNLRKAEQVLGMLAPVAGGSDLESAVRKATSLLKRAPNIRKQLLLLTDNQLCTWESIDEMRLAGRSFDMNRVPDLEAGMTNDIELEGVDASGKESVPEMSRAVIVARLPQKAENISVDRLLIGASLVTADRPVPIEVEVRNGGSTTVRDLKVKLLVDGRETAAESLIQLEPGVNSTVRFLYAFPKPGQHVVSGTVEIADQLPEDNRFDSVVDVIPNLAILVVNGSTDADPTQQSATFAQLALDPASLREKQMGGDIGNTPEGNAGRAIIATTIEATHLDEIESLENFQLVMLCDVPRLPVDAAERVADFVEDGGSLWVIPSEQSDKSFYNNWRVPLSDEPIMPVQLREWNRWVGKANRELPRLSVALDVAGRPFVSSLFERGDHDLEDISVRQFWSTIPSEQAIVGMRLTNSEALFAEQAIGRGRVLMQNVSLAPRDSNFPANLAFPVLMHLWTYHLAASHGLNSNFEPTSDLVTKLATRIDSTEKTERLQLVAPSGKTQDIPLAWEQDTPWARIGHVTAPGVYQLLDKNSGARVSGFAIHRDKEESNLSVVSEDRLNEISHGLGIELIDDVDQLTSPVAVESAGTEIWNTLLFIVLWLMAAECLVTKWIRSRRGIIAPSDAIAFSNSNFHARAVTPLVTAAESPSLWATKPLDDSLTVSGGTTR